MRDERGYLAAIEEIFLTVRGRGVQWTHADARQAAAWQAAGVDVATVADVVAARARAYRFLRGDTADLPPRLGFYARSVARRVGGPCRPSATGRGPGAPTKGDAAATHNAAATNHTNNAGNAAAGRAAVHTDPLETLLDEAIGLGERGDRWQPLYAQSAEALRARLERPADDQAAKGLGGLGAGDDAASLDADQRWLQRHAESTFDAALRSLTPAEGRALHDEARGRLTERERGMRPRAQARRLKRHLRDGLAARGLSLPTWDGWQPRPDDGSTPSHREPTRGR
jgi:hypothetical protein